MVLLSVVSRQNKVFAPILLRSGLNARYQVLKKLSQVERSRNNFINAEIPAFVSQQHALDDKSYFNEDGFLFDNGANESKDATLCMLTLLPFSQRLISIEIDDDLYKMIKLRRQLLEPSFLDIWAEKLWSRLFPADKATSDENVILKNSGRTKFASLLQKKRMESFEKYIRPVLLPNEKWSDRHTWAFNHRFVMWLRKEYLMAKFSQELARIVHSNALSVTEKMMDFEKLDCFDEVQKSFGIQSWSRVKQDTTKDDNAMKKKILESLNGRMYSDIDFVFDENELDENLQLFKLLQLNNTACLPENTNLSDLSLEELFELTGSIQDISQYGSFNLFCEMYNIFEFWNKQYIDALAKYLLERTKKYEENDEETVILEVGAGNGLLSHHLEKSMEKIISNSSSNSNHLSKGNSIVATLSSKSKNKKSRQRHKSQKKVQIKADSDGNKEKSRFRMPKIVSTDNGSWKIKPLPYITVEKMSVNEALEKYASVSEKNVIILCSWMLKDEDWTEEFRRDDKTMIKEYILIGEADDGCCGHNWFTWGNQKYSSSGGDAVAPYVEDGWNRKDLDHLSKLQLSRYDTKLSRSSSTVSFRRS